jgi:hypothetical protein
MVLEIINNIFLNLWHDGKLVNSQKEGFIYMCQDNNGDVIKDKTRLVVLN